MRNPSQKTIETQTLLALVVKRSVLILASLPVGKLAFAIETSPTHTFVQACVPDERDCFLFHASAAEWRNCSGSTCSSLSAVLKPLLFGSLQ